MESSPFTVGFYLKSDGFFPRKMSDDQRVTATNAFSFSKAEGWDDLNEWWQSGSHHSEPIFVESQLQALANTKKWSPIYDTRRLHPAHQLACGISPVKSMAWITEAWGLAFLEAHPRSSKFLSIIIGYDTSPTSAKFADELMSWIPMKQPCLAPKTSHADHIWSRYADLKCCRELLPPPVDKHKNSTPSYQVGFFQQNLGVDTH